MWLEYRTRNFQVGGSILIAGHLQATLSKLCSGQLSLLPSAGREMSSRLRTMGWRPNACSWLGGGMSARCTADPIVR